MANKYKVLNSVMQGTCAFNDVTANGRVLKYLRTALAVEQHKAEEERLLEEIKAAGIDYVQKVVIKKWLDNTNKICVFVNKI